MSAFAYANNTTTKEDPKLFPGEHHILDLWESTYENLDDDKSVFDYLNKKQTIDGWSNKSNSITIFATKYGKFKNKEIFLFGVFRPSNKKIALF